MKTFPLSAKNRRMMYLNNADANTLTAEWTLAKGTNFPSYSGVSFWYIHTFAYALVSDNPEVISEGRQIAYSYLTANVIFQRSCESGTWTAWTQVPTHAEIEALNSKVTTITIPANSDLNNYISPGIYGQHSTNIAATITNTPVNTAFLLEVLHLQPSTSGNWIGALQRLTDLTGHYIYVRRMYTNGSGQWSFGSWYNFTGTQVS